MRKSIVNKISFLIVALFFSANLLGQSAFDSSLSFPFSGSQSGGVFMNTPSNFNLSVVYDPLTNTYILQNKIGGLNFGEPKVMSFLEYQKYAQNNLKWSKVGL